VRPFDRNSYRLVWRASGASEKEHAVDDFRGQASFDQHVIDVGDQFAGGKTHLVGVQYVPLSRYFGRK